MRLIKKLPLFIIIICSTVMTASVCRSEIQKYHFAGTPIPDKRYRNILKTLTNIGYIACYDESRKNPAWVSYSLFKTDNQKKYLRISSFTIDTRTRARVSTKAYTHSKFDRGHMAPSYGIFRCYGLDAQRETYKMSNIIPQKHKLNNGVWKKLEMNIAKYYTDEFKKVWIITGPIYEKNVKKLLTGISIPDKFYKIVIRGTCKNPEVRAWIIPMDIDSTKSLDEYFESVDMIEKMSGFNFFSELDDSIEKRIELNRSK